MCVCVYSVDYELKTDCLNLSMHSFFYRAIGGEINHDGDFLVFESNHFRNGFMYKSFGMGAIVSDHTPFLCYDEIPLYMSLMCVH